MSPQKIKKYKSRCSNAQIFSHSKIIHSQLLCLFFFGTVCPANTLVKGLENNS